MRYEIILGTKLEDFKIEVNAFLDEGWQLYGNLVIETIYDADDKPHIRFYQTMIKDDLSDDILPLWATQRIRN